MHEPVYRRREGAGTAVIFIHGFMGSPDSFEDLAEAVYDAGYSYVTLLLPGHGSGMDEFVRRGLDDWERHVQSEIDKIKGDYKTLFLVGHSMGGLLALNASLIPENKITGVCLISTPIKALIFNPRSLWMRVRLLTFPKDNEIKAKYGQSISVELSKILYWPLIVKPLYNFYRLVYKTRAHLSEVFVPVCMFHSKNDETTSYKSVKILREGLRNAKLFSYTIDKSWHTYFDADERGIIRDRLIEFIRQGGLHNG